MPGRFAVGIIFEELSSFLQSLLDLLIQDISILVRDDRSHFDEIFDAPEISGHLSPVDSSGEGLAHLRKVEGKSLAIVLVEGAACFGPLTADRTQKDVQ